jgi:hypothetical protein
MRKGFFVVLLAVAILAFGTISCMAQPTANDGDGKLQFQAYTEYINFTNSSFERGAWGGGVLGRWLFSDLLGVQTNMTFYGEAPTTDPVGDLSFSNWRLTLLLHSYLPNTYNKLHAHLGIGTGVQFNDNIGDVKVHDPWLGHVLGGLTYKINNRFSIEGEIGYQFGSADLVYSHKDSLNVDALFVRLGANLMF